MKEKIISQKIKLFVLAIFTLLTLCLLSRIAPKTMAQANVPFDNPKYTFNTVNDGRISTVANPDETTILIFGYVGCSKTRSTLDSLSECNWIKRDDIRVIYVDAEGHSQQEVLSWAEAYDCPEMTFCYYDEMDDTMMKVMYSYTNKYGGSYPVVVLIDGENKVQNVSTGKKTATEILEDIKGFKDMEGSDTDTPPSDADSELGFVNYPYILNSVDGDKVSTKANKGETTVLLFGYTTCGKTKSTLKEIDQNDWFDNRTDVRVIFADEHGHSLIDVKEFAQNYNSGNIIFCHDESCNNYYGITVKYLHMFNENGGTYPYIVFIDKNNRVRDLTLGPQTAEDIIEKIKSFTTIDDNKPSENPDDSKPDDKPSENPSDKPDDKPSENPDGSKPDDKPSENPDDKPNDKPSENPDNSKPDDKPSENPSDKPDDKPSDSGTTNIPNNNQGSNNSNSSNNNGSSSSNNGNTSSGSSTWTPNYSSGSNNSGSSSTSTSTNGSSSSTPNITSPVPSVNNEKDTVEDTTKKEDSIEDSKPLDDTSKESDVVVSDTVPTTPSNDTTQANNQVNDNKKTKTNTKKKAKVNAVKAAKGKKAVSGTIKLNSGKAVKNATIKIYVNNKKKITAKTNGKGEFSVKLSKKLKKGDKIKLVITSSNTKKITKIIEIK